MSDDACVGPVVQSAGRDAEESRCGRRAGGDAERIGSYHQITDPSTGRADLHGLVSLLGGRIEVAHTNESLHVYREGEFTIFIPATTSSRRDRFTIAHELGHYYLHYLYPKVEHPEGVRPRAA